MGLFVLAVVIGYFFYRMGTARSTNVAPPVEEGTSVSALLNQPGATRTGGAVAAKQRFHIHWKQWDILVGAAVIGGAIAFLVGSLDFADRARIVPYWTGIAVIAFTTLHILRKFITDSSGSGRLWTLECEV